MRVRAQVQLSNHQNGHVKWVLPSAVACPTPGKDAGEGADIRRTFA